MNLLSRILLSIYAAVLALVSLAAMVITVWPDVFNNLSSRFSFNVLENRSASLIVFLIALTLFSLSLVFLFSGVGFKTSGRTILRRGDMGEIRISLDAIENISQAAVKRIPSVRDCRALCTKTKDTEKVTISIRVIVMSDTNMPLVSEEIQKKVKKAVEDCTGVSVLGVQVNVDNIYSVMKARVE
ncbi:MAG TPA: alkaline shock response membrane anchor protein AmaP [Clostridiales bacterium]|nr:alkaline shock response membrane anchor protein AmaP [Clostridiales bacterium]